MLYYLNMTMIMLTFCSRANILPSTENRVSPQVSLIDKTDLRLCLFKIMATSKNSWSSKHMEDQFEDIPLKYVL